MIFTINAVKMFPATKTNLKFSEANTEDMQQLDSNVEVLIKSYPKPNHIVTILALTTSLKSSLLIAGGIPSLDKEQIFLD